MRHKRKTVKLGRNTSHRRCLMANLLKSLLIYGRIKTSLAKGKELKRRADKLVTLSKKGDLASLRRIKAELMLRYNKLTPKEARAVKEGDLSSYNDDRKIIDQFKVLADRFENRQGGYTRLMRLGQRRGDASSLCFVEYLEKKVEL